MSYKDKEYARGSAVEHVFPDGGKLINFSINIFDDNIKLYADEKGWIKLVMNEKRQTDEYKNTHSVTINTWKPESKTQSAPAVPSNQQSFTGPSDIGEIGDLPFS